MEKEKINWAEVYISSEKGKNLVKKLSRKSRKMGLHIPTTAYITLMIFFA